MNTELTEEQKQIKSLIKQFCEKEVDMKKMDELCDKVSVAKSVEEVRALYPKELIKKLHDVGLRQLAVPAKYGGGGADRFGSVTRTIAAEQAGYSMGLASRLLGVPWMHCAAIGAYQTTEEQKDWFFTQFMEDPTLFTAMVMSEPNGTTDLTLPYNGPGAQINTTAYKDGDEWVINGDKMFSSGAPVAGLMRVQAKTDKTKNMSEGTTFFWVKKDTPGVSFTLNRFQIEEIVGNAQTNLENVRVPDSHRLGQVGKGAIASGELYAAKMLLYAELLGHAQKIYEGMVEYAKEKVQGGRPIIQHSHIAGLLGQAAIDIEATRSFFYRAACENDQREKAGEPMFNFWSGGSQYLAKKMAWRLCETATSVYGGIVGSVDLPVERFARRAFCWLAPGNTVNFNEMKASMEYNQHKIGPNY